MAVETLVPVEQYLTTSYSPDCDYVDGVVLERNVGELDHSDLQGEIVTWFRTRRKTLGIWAFPEQRVQVSARRFRVPDVCLVVGRPTEQIFRTPPLAVFEILSKDDRMSEMQERLRDYIAFGVRHVWLIDPRGRRAFACTADGSREIKDGVLRSDEPAFELSLAELYASME
ncbi:MAG: Uma2 family endonuclease [Acidobacteria bacterium]|nr:Uma2 family endonuclease [Acidobacteriota bacterium]